MSTLLLDTNIVSYQMRGHSLAEAYRPHLTGHTLAISFMTVAELYEGARRARWGAARMQLFETAVRAYLVLPFSMDLCRSWADVRAARRKQPISTDDAWIAATAILYQMPLVTHNAADFRNIGGLSVISIHSEL